MRASRTSKMIDLGAEALQEVTHTAACSPLYTERLEVLIMYATKVPLVIGLMPKFL